jgi:hypothetical protein
VELVALLPLIGLLAIAGLQVVVTLHVWGAARESARAVARGSQVGAPASEAVRAALPWSLTLDTNAPSAAPNIVAQGDGGSITCRIIVDDVVKDERTVTGVNPLTYCFLKSA